MDGLQDYRQHDVDGLEIYRNDWRWGEARIRLVGDARRESRGKGRRKRTGRRRTTTTRSDRVTDAPRRLGQCLPMIQIALALMNRSDEEERKRTKEDETGDGEEGKREEKRKRGRLVVCSVEVPRVPVSFSRKID